MLYFHMSHLHHHFEPMVKRIQKLQKAARARMNFKALEDVEDAQAELAVADMEIHELDARLHTVVGFLADAHNPK